MSPANDEAMFTVPAGCVGVIEHTATPDESVVSEQASPAPRVKVTGRPSTGVGVGVSSSTRVAVAVNASW